MLATGTASASHGRAAEASLVLARKALLADALADVSVPESLDSAVSVAMHMHQSEYAFVVSPAERAGIAELEARIARQFHAGGDVPALWIAVLACYQPLTGTFVDDDRLLASTDRRLAPLLAETLYEARTLEKRAAEIPSLNPITDDASRRVAQQYEENPYPRWHLADVPALQPTTLVDYLTKGLPALSARIVFPHRPRVLIAGCGTGHHAILVAKQVPDAEILAIDLSRASLAYASLRAEEAGVTNVAFRQCDILELPGSRDGFDYIECCGVLHHTRSPAEGLAKLTATLKPGGIMRLSLYSKLARRHIHEIRDLIGPIEDDLTKEEISSIRRQVLYEIETRGWTHLLGIRDLHSSSGFRDMFLNRLEHTFTVPELSNLLLETNLKFLRMNVAPEVLALYAKECPEDVQGNDLLSWHRVELAQPDTFLGMYDFIVAKE